MSTILLDFSLIVPIRPLAWIPIGITIASVAIIYMLSLMRSAVNAISEQEAKYLHNRRSRHEQRIYKLFKRKEKVKASLSTAETFFTLVFLMAATSMVEGGDGYLWSRMALMSFYPNPAWNYMCFFVLMAFVLVIAVVVPGRLIDDQRKTRILVRFGWLLDLVCMVAGAVSFSNAYSNHREDSSNEQLTVAIGSSDAKTGEKDMIRNILQFGDIEVREIMTPRHDIVAVEKGDSFSAVKRKVVENNFSRMPVYESTTDSIFGIVYVKDLLKHVSRGDDFDWTKLIRRIKYVSENKKISDLLKEFQQKKTHMAAVCDEYGGISGLITMQDILEQIVGEISDEFDDDANPMFRRVSDNYYVFDGKIMIGDFCRELSIDDQDFDSVRGDAESLAGLLLEMRGEFPKMGEEIPYRNLTFSVEAFSGRRIEKIGVRIK